MCIGGDTMSRWVATHAFLRPSRSPQYWLVGRQVKCHPAAASHAVEGEVVDPGTSARSQRSCLQKLRTCSRTTSYQRNGIVVNGKSSLAYPRGPCLQYCMSICGNTWTDALHAAHFELLVSSVQIQVGWSVPWPALCVCVRTCVFPYCSSCLWYTWKSIYILGAHACFFISLCLFFASVGQASARPIASLPWTLFTSLLTHRLVLLCIDAHCFIFWALPGDVLAAPESALGLERCNTSLSLSPSLITSNSTNHHVSFCRREPEREREMHCIAPCQPHRADAGGARASPGKIRSGEPKTIVTGC